EKDLFGVEYWELEQAKLSKNPKSLSLQGKIALVTGAASGIGKACVERLLAEGACVVGVDLQESVMARSEATNQSYIGFKCDVTKEPDIQNALESTVRRFGGLDIVVSNAGVFPPSMEIKSMDPAVWDKSLKVNLTSHQLLLKHTI